MSLRCLLFSSHQEIVQPICEVLAEIGIEGEHCENAVDAVEKVTTHLFQIVITDWSDQPEASFLLKTARDQKAAHRPLTLAIVSEADRPAALQAGANSVLLKPVRVEQIRDTMRTACDLLRAKQQPGQQAAVASAAPAAQAEPEEALSAAAAASAASAPLPASISAPVPSSVGQLPEAGFRPGEFLPSAGTGPGSQIDTEKGAEATVSPDEPAAEEVDALAELEPTAAAVPEPREMSAEAATREPTAKLSGWAELQARLNAGKRPPAETANNELMSFSDMQPVEKDSAEPLETQEAVEPSLETAKRPAEQTAVEQVSAVPEDKGEDRPTTASEPQPSRAKTVILATLAACLLVAGAMPRTRLQLIQGGGCAVKAVQAWLNPPPPQVPQAVAQHESFGQAGDEYKLPTATPIPDATTDPSQIRVVPVVDPTAKPDKNANANGGQPQVVDTSPQDQNPTAPAQGENNSAQTQNPPDSQNQVAAAKPAEAITTSSTPASGASSSASSVQPVTPTSPVVVPARSASPSSSALHTVSASAPAGIPSSLQTQLAPNAPAAGGTTPPEEAMSAIEPVKLPEAAVRDLLTQKVDPEYPASAKTSGLQGSVTLQVLIGHDGTVQDAKFLQGSLLFARAAIDAVKQWQFKPYSMNGRAVSVQSAITLSFRP
jgi:TonB family protein